jgi:hypothetical protein
MSPPFWTFAWMVHMLWSAHSADTLAPRRLLGIQGIAQAQSTFLNTDFMSLYLRGRYVGDDVKGRSFDRLRALNRAGAELYWNVAYGERPDSGFMGKHRLGWHVHISSSTLQGILLTDDAGRLVLYGNAPWAGDSLRLSPLKIQSITWQEAGVGLYKFCTFPRLKVRWMISLNYVNPNQWFMGSIRDGMLYTSEDGSRIKLSARAQIRQSDPHGAFYFNPRGAGFSMHLSAGIRWRGFSMDAEARDLGRLYWNIGSQQVSLDTSLTFEGVYVPHVLSVDSTFFQNLVDSARTAFLRPVQRGRISMTLPALFSLRFTGYFPGDKVGLMAQLRYRSGFFQIPETALGILWHPNSQAALMISGQYGGWGRWNGGLHLAFRFKNGWKLSLGSNTMDAMLAPSFNGGLGGYFCLTKTWQR